MSRPLTGPFSTGTSQPQFGSAKSKPTSLSRAMAEYRVREAADAHVNQARLKAEFLARRAA